VRNFWELAGCPCHSGAGTPWLNWEILRESRGERQHREGQDQVGQDSE